MPPKKPPQNAFFFFMVDYKKKQEAKGVKFPGGLKDVAFACSDEWKKMSPQQKGPYESRAKDAKFRNGESGAKYTSQGVPISLIQKEAKRKEEFEHNMNDWINLNVSITGGRESLIKNKFYFIHVNWLCRKLLPSGESDFYPVEFGVVQFSLKNGVERSYHRIISIDVPMGYAAEAMIHAEETHKILRNANDGEKDFGIMYRKLIEFLAPETVGRELPPIFCTQGVTEIVPGLLRRMTAAAGESVDRFRVYSIEILFFGLRNSAAVHNNSAGFPTMTLAERELQKDVFDTISEIACDYHRNIDGAITHCSLSIVIRWAYTICDFCCADLDIEMKPGRHCPMDTDIESIESLRKEVKEEWIDSYGTGSCGIVSMTGVTSEHRLRTSARTYQQEQKRRAEDISLQIIDHSKLQSSNTQSSKAAPKQATAGFTPGAVTARSERPLRKPNTKSYAMIGMSAESLPSMDDMNFPAIGGRGAAKRKNLIDQFPPLGHGRSSSMNN